MRKSDEEEEEEKRPNNKGEKEAGVCYYFHEWTRIKIILGEDKTDGLFY